MDGALAPNLVGVTSALLEYFVVGIRFRLSGTAPAMSRSPPNQTGMMAKDGLMRGENVLGKIQPSELY